MSALPPETDQLPQGEATSASARQEAGRGGYSMETWLELKARLRTRVAQREQTKQHHKSFTHRLQQAWQQQVMPLLRMIWQLARHLPSYLQKRVGMTQGHPAWRRFKADAKWNARLMWRYYRPKLRAFVHDGAGQAGYMAGYIYGWFFWYGRKWRQDADFRYKGYVLAGSFVSAFVAIYLIVAVWGWISGPRDGQLTVPGMSLGDIAVIDTRDPATMGQQPPAMPERLESATGFRFERYVGQSAQGQLVLDGTTAQAALRQILPVGTKATEALAFIASLYPSNGREVLEVVKQHCLGLPSSKVFRQRTITCTYVHGLPDGRQAFWVVAFTSDRQARLTELSATARLVK